MDKAIAGLDAGDNRLEASVLCGQLDDSATASVTEGQFAPARISTRRALLVEGVGSGTPVPVAYGAPTSGGATPYSVIWPGNTTGVIVKASAGQVYGVYVTNIAATPAYLKLYDKATAPTTSDVPKHRFLVPGNAAGAEGVYALPIGIEFLAGISIRVTTGSADNDATAPTASDVIVNLDYK